MKQTLSVVGQGIVTEERVPEAGVALLEFREPPLYRVLSSSAICDDSRRSAMRQQKPRPYGSRVMKILAYLVLSIQIDLGAHFRNIDSMDRRVQF